MQTLTSQHLNLSFIAPSQAQKHITLNEALKTLDTVINLSVKSTTLTFPPSDPAQGDRFIIGKNPTGLWENKEGYLVQFEDAGWTYFSPKIGWRVWDEATQALKVWTSLDWDTLTGDEGQYNFMGINTETDLSNRLTISSHSTLFTHEGQGHQLKINKNSMPDTASLIFQDNFIGHAEMGLVGEDDFSIKVSSDGIDFTPAVNISCHAAETTISNLKVPHYWRWYNSTTITTIDTDGTGAKCLFDTASHNADTAYDTATSDFTAPISGLYLVNVNFNTHGNNQMNCDLRVNNIAVSRIQFFPNNFSHLSKTFLLPLQAGDILNLYAVGYASVRFDGGGAFDNICLMRLGVL